MENINKIKLESDINTAYENQSDAVKELLQKARENLACEKVETFTGKSEKIRQISNIKNVINKNTTMINQIEEMLNNKFNEVNSNITSNSKNLDLMFNKGANKEQYEQSLEEMKEELIQSIESIKVPQNNDNIINFQAESERRLMKNQEEMYKKITDLQHENEKLLIEVQEKNEEKLNQFKNEMFEQYGKEDKNLFNKYLEEKHEYIKELEEKDRQIRELNYKIYEYEEKLDKEIQRRQRNSVFGLFRKNIEEEQQTSYTCQILNYIAE